MARQRKLHYAWIVAGVTFLTLLVAAGLRATPGVLIVPLETEFGWSRATISFAIGLNICLYGLIGPFAAAVMDRFGLRRTMLAALACIAAGVALTPLMTRPWQLVVLWGVVVGTGSGATALVLGATVVARWFATRRGLVIGILTGEHRHRPADLSAGPRQPRRELRLANGLSGRRRGCAGADPGRGTADARPAA